MPKGWPIATASFLTGRQKLSLMAPMSENNKRDLKLLRQLENHLPQKIPQNSTLPVSTTASDPLGRYLATIRHYKLLSPEEEKDLVKTLVETGDIEVAKKLVLANLRLVVKIAMEYRYSYNNVMDLIQEGNMGLMKAVSKYNPEKGAKLSYYASWWIRSFILKFILDNFRLVKVGTTQDQKKLFYNLMSEKERLEKQGIQSTPKLISQNLGVSEKSVIEMEKRLGPGSSDMALDTPLKESGNTTLAEILSSEQESIEDQFGHLQELGILQEHLKEFLNDLKERDRDIFKKRLLSELPLSLQAIADEYGVSRERIRQIEERLLKKLRVYMSDFLR